MNTLFLTECDGSILVDNDTNEVDRVDDCVNKYSIRKGFLIEKPTHIIYGFKGKTEEIDAEAGDIVLQFSDTKHYDKHLIVVKNDEWRKRIKTIAEAVQKEKEEWAKAHADQDIAEKCKDC